MKKTTSFCHVILERIGNFIVGTTFFLHTFTREGVLEFSSSPPVKSLILNGKFSLLSFKCWDFGQWTMKIISSRLFPRHNKYQKIKHISTRGGSALMIMQIAGIPRHIFRSFLYLPFLRIMFSLPTTLLIIFSGREEKKGQPIMKIIQSRHFSST